MSEEEEDIRTRKGAEEKRQQCIEREREKERERDNFFLGKFPEDEGFLALLFFALCSRVRFRTKEGHSTLRTLLRVSVRGRHCSTCAINRTQPILVC